MSLTRYTFFGPWVREPDPAGAYVTLTDVRALVEPVLKTIVAEEDAGEYATRSPLYHDAKRLLAALKETL